jgi:SAM-dependent methyltransferase
MGDGTTGAAGYRIDHGDAAQVASEAERLDVLAGTFDDGTQRLLRRVGVDSGWVCLEVGAGQGSIARWLAEVVGDDGHVTATDVDVAFVGDLPANVSLLEHDVSRDPLPVARFDLVHTRGVLQHVPGRDDALANMAAALKPGGWVVVEDIDWLVCDEQPLPEPFASLHRAMRAFAAERLGYDAHYGRRVLAEMQGLGLVDVDAHGTVRAMHGGTPGAEWYVMAIERSIPEVVAAGYIDESRARDAVAQAREPGFGILSPLRISAWGRQPYA